MNEVFLMGKILTDVEFKFIINSKNISVAKFELQTIKDKQIIKVKSYNEIADFVYSKLNIDDMVVINGYINEKHEIIVKEIMQ